MKKILFICALPEERKALVECFSSEPEKLDLSEKIDLSIEKFIEYGSEFFVSESGMGNVNAAVNLTLILSQIDIDQIILIGVGGALDSKLNIGDMILSQSVIQHDYKSSLEEGTYLMKPGDLILSSQEAINYSAMIRSKECIFDINQIANKEINVSVGLVASGSEFVGTTQRKKAIHEQTGALLVDMEASAIGHVANMFKIPFIVAKTVSDKLHPDGTIEVDFAHFLSNASQNAAMIAKDIIELIQDKK